MTHQLPGIVVFCLPSPSRRNARITDICVPGIGTQALGFLCPALLP